MALNRFRRERGAVGVGRARTHKLSFVQRALVWLDEELEVVVGLEFVARSGTEPLRVSFVSIG